ncbi:MAG: biotin/lipoyl-containing protein [Bacteroidales bacterium]
MSYFKNPNHITAFIPGTIVEVKAKEGKNTKKGEVLLILDAMKMNNRLEMPFDGKIVKVNVSPGERVAKNTVLIEVEPIK